MKPTPLVLAAAFGMLLADPAMAQSRRKDDSHRVADRQTITADRNEQRRERQQATRVRADSRRPIRATVGTRPRREDPRDYDRDHYDRRSRITVIAPGVVRRDDYGYGSSGYGYGTGAYGYSAGEWYAAGRVWNRVPGMTCQRLDDELEWAHDEWHYRHDRERDRRGYAVEHARLELRIAEERLYAGCDHPYEERDCRERGHYPRTGEALETAILVLDLLLRDP